MAPNDDITTEQEQLSDRVAALVNTVDHDEMWGINLRAKDCHSIPYRIVMEKFLRANGHDVERAATHFENVLRWRKQIDPRRALLTVYKPERFGRIGTVSTHTSPTRPDVYITWNRYGLADDQAETFGDVMAFIQYRIALMEAGIEAMRLANAIEMIPSDGLDRYRMIQVYDCKDVDFKCSKVSHIIQQQCEVLSKNYPELIDRTILGNTPAMFSVFNRQVKKHFKRLGAESKLSCVSTSTEAGELLAGECGLPLGSVPDQYGGKHYSVFDSEVLHFSPYSASKTVSPAAGRRGILKWNNAGRTRSQETAGEDGVVDGGSKSNYFSSIRSKFSNKHHNPQTDASPAEKTNAASSITGAGEVPPSVEVTAPALGKENEAPTSIGASAGEVPPSIMTTAHAQGKENEAPTVVGMSAGEASQSVMPTAHAKGKENEVPAGVGTNTEDARAADSASTEPSHPSLGDVPSLISSSDSAPMTALRPPKAAQQQQQQQSMDPPDYLAARYKYSWD